MRKQPGALFRGDAVVLIESLSVSGGFLGGLRLEFVPGLNTIIGPRGAGKTSVVELIRYCLGSRTLSERLNVATLNHARAILADGIATVVLRDGSESIELSRGANDDAPRVARWSRPFILAQNEIESIGLDASSRVALIDGFDEGPERALDESETQLRALQIEITAVREEIRSASDELEDFIGIDDQLKELRSRLKALIGKNTALTALQTDVSEKEQRLGELQLRIEEFGVAMQRVEAFSVSVIRMQPDVEYLDNFASRTNIDTLISVAKKATKSAAELSKLAQQSSTILRETVTATTTEIEALRTEIQPARNELQLSSAEFAALNKQAALVEARVRERDRLLSRLSERAQRLESLKRERVQLLSILRGSATERTTRRREIAESLTRQLAPQIRVSVIPAGSLDDYTSRLVDAFKGSGLHAATLAPQITKTVSPEELVDYVEGDAPELLARSARITLDRAKKVIVVLQRADLAAILTSRIDDDICLELLDGLDYKTTTELSTGQRCTVVLPILLCRDRFPLILDQPEDHLDNAFIVDTLVRAIIERKSAVQIIATTHNANIPVLGNADFVVHLESNGRAGFTRVSGLLLDSLIVKSITNIMEGGKEAFQRRARFYDDAAIVA